MCQVGMGEMGGLGGNTASNCCHQSESPGGECHSPCFGNVQSFSNLGLPDLGMSNLGHGAYLY